ncbi:unnamed protein product [Caenorhabditis brenneri]
MSAYELSRMICDSYMETEDYKQGIYKDNRYEPCCVKSSYCSFYAQTWFWGVCGGVILLLIIASIVGSVFCCCRGRGGGGMESKSSEEDASEPSDSTKSTMNNPA